MAVAETASSAPADGADAAHCERIVRVHARTFTFASRFLPTEKRRAAFALYAFCRLADDMVDTVTADASAASRLEDYRKRLDLALAGNPSGPVFRELARVVRRYGVPASVLHELVDGVARDLRPVRYTTWPELAVYCEGVASTVGEMCAHVFGIPGGPEARASALRYARALGVAMQLTNILRDVGEDARRGRCYLPEEDMARFGVGRDELFAAALDASGTRGPHRLQAGDPRWRRLMEFEVRRARSIYDAAIPGVALLARDTRRCASACAWGYAGILDAIEERKFDTLHGRARVGSWARLSVLWNAWRVGEESDVASAEVRGGSTLAGAAVAERAADELLRWA